MVGRSIKSMVKNWEGAGALVREKLCENLAAATAALPSETLVARGDGALQRTWPPLSATAYLDFARTGTRRTFEAALHARRDALRDLVLAECAQRQGRYIDSILDALWSTSEEASWCMPSHLFLQQAGYGLPDIEEPVVDLGVGIASGLLATATALLGDALDAVSPQVTRRIRAELARRILVPCAERDDFWWMSRTPHPIFKTIRINNWNPWICSNWLLAAVLVESDEAQLRRTLERIVDTLDRFLAVYGEDGGCPEGPAYWKHAMSGLLQCLEILSPILDQAALREDERLRNMARFVIDTRIAGDYFVNFADSAPRITLPACLVQRWAELLGDDRLARYAGWLAGEQDLARRPSSLVDGQSLFEALANHAVLPRLGQGAPTPDLPRDVWLPSLEMLVARDRAGSAEGWMLSAKGGHNDNSHNHNDVGSFMVYRDGLPLIVDAGVGTYTEQTFSPQRYDIWTMRSRYHNGPTIAGAVQPPGRLYCASEVRHAVDAETASLSMRLETAYPDGLGLECWERRLTLRRGEGITISDSFRASGATEASVHLLTAAQVEVAADGRLDLLARALGEGRLSGSGSVEFDPELLLPEIETVPIDDPPLQASWGERLTRIVLRLRRPMAEAALAVHIGPAAAVPASLS